MTSILKTLDCIDKEHVLCSAAGYDSSRFQKFHDGVLDLDVDVAFLGWFIAFWFVDLSFQVEEVSSTSGVCNDTVVFLRYVEKVQTPSHFFWISSTDYPFGQVFLQHEQANVTVDDQCRMIQ